MPHPGAVGLHPGRATAHVLPPGHTGDAPAGHHAGDNPWNALLELRVADSRSGIYVSSSQRRSSSGDPMRREHPRPLRLVLPRSSTAFATTGTDGAQSPGRRLDVKAHPGHGPLCTCPVVVTARIDGQVEAADAAVSGSPRSEALDTPAPPAAPRRQRSAVTTTPTCLLLGASAFARAGPQPADRTL